MNHPFSLHEHVLLREYSTLRIGGPARFVMHASSSDALIAAIAWARDRSLPWRVIGEGSNVFFADEGMDAAIIVYRSALEPRRMPDGAVHVDAGLSLLAFVRWCVVHGLAGVELLAGIPGTVGGGLSGNAGAYGMCISDCLRDALVVDVSGNTRWMTRAELHFSYRTSLLKRWTGYICEARFDLAGGDATHLATEMERILADRARKHPDYKSIPTAGSFFKNVEASWTGGHRLAAGRLLELAGAKDLRVGDAALWGTHANIVINRGAATAADVRALTAQMAERVHQAFGIALHPEVEYVGA